MLCLFVNKCQLKVLRCITVILQTWFKYVNNWGCSTQSGRTIVVELKFGLPKLRFV